MEKVWERAQNGDLDYFQCMSTSEIEGVLKAKDEDDRSVLHVAAAGGNSELVQLLSSKGHLDWINQSDDEVGRFEAYGE